MSSLRTTATPILLWKLPTPAPRESSAKKPFATTVDECTRMIEACGRPTERFFPSTTPIAGDPTYDVAREAIRSGSIGEVQRIVATLGGPRAMMFRNGTHLVDGVCFFADSEPKWVFAELEPGYESL